jgi:cytochrome c oxidase subunit 2
MTAAPSNIQGLLGSLPAASSFAPAVDSLFFGLLATSAFVVCALGLLTLGILIKYRRGATANRAPLRVATWKIEVCWIAGTLAVFLVFFWRGAAVFLEIKRPPQGAQAITVVGRQWMWDVRHPDGRREFNSLHVLVGQAVLLEMSSEDVIHSFFVPAFRLKQDLVPGKVVDAWFTPTRPGTYTLLCAQYCGTAHAQMLGTITVLDKEAFAAWEEAGRAVGVHVLTARASADRGRSLFADFGCGICHNGPSEGRAPELAGIYDTMIRTADGRVIRAGTQFLHDAILHAPSNALNGYSLRMPDYEGSLSEGDVADLIAYIRTLEGNNLANASP